MIRNEFRALLPVWGACAAALLASISGVDFLRMYSAPIYFIGAASLGAMAVGHEYSHRTIGLLLSQPVSRSRVLLTKLGVLSVLLAALIVVALGTLTLGRDTLFRTPTIWLPPLAALFITPWLTMISRSPLGGTVFTLSIAGVVLVASEWIGVARYGFTHDVDTFRVAMLWRTMIALCVVCGSLTWRTFQRLEALDSRGSEIHLRSRSRATTAGFTRRRAAWLLVQKEVHLHQLAFVIVGLYIAGYLAASAVGPAAVLSLGMPTALTMLYCGLLAMVIGAQASAEERNLRTLESQLLAPMSAPRQWAIKAGTALALVGLLTIVLPTILVVALPPEGMPRFYRHFPLWQTVAIVDIVVLTSISLYVSSLCSSGMWALLLSVPAVGGALVFISRVADPIAERAIRGLGQRPSMAVTNYGLLLLTAGVVMLLLRFAYVNHRSSIRDRWRTAAQIGVLAASITAGMTAIAVAGAFIR